MALVFTAISNTLAAHLIAVRSSVNSQAEVLALLDWRQLAALAMVSIGLYGFGMSLNDIIDRRRDRQFAAHRPLPSGRIRLLSAHVVCFGLIAMASAAGWIYASFPAPGWRSLVPLAVTAVLITAYDFAGKYLVAVGLLTLGLIRFFHALIPAPDMVLLWHPLLLFTHVAVLSTVAYHWEQKRPALTPVHWWGVFGGVALLDVALVLVEWRKWSHGLGDALWLKQALVIPFALMVGYAAIGWMIWHRSAGPRQAGQTLMLTGLLWLILYDAALVGIYVGPAYAGFVALLLPLSYLSVQVMRWWASIILLSQAPAYERARHPSNRGFGENRD